MNFYLHTFGLRDATPQNAQQFGANHLIKIIPFRDQCATALRQKDSTHTLHSPGSLAEDDDLRSSRRGASTYNSSLFVLSRNRCASLVFSSLLPAA